MNFKNLISNKLLVLVFFLILTLGLKFSIVDTPYIRDAFQVYVSPSMLIKNGDLSSLSLGIHPPMYYEIFASVLKLFGESLLVGHIFNLAFTILL